MRSTSAASSALLRSKSCNESGLLGSSLMLKDAPQDIVEVLSSGTRPDIARESNRGRFRNLVSERCNPGHLSADGTGAARCHSLPDMTGVLTLSMVSAIGCRCRLQNSLPAGGNEYSGRHV